jgi:hypothetical protein
VPAHWNALRRARIVRDVVRLSLDPRFVRRTLLANLVSFGQMQLHEILRFGDILLTSGRSFASVVPFMVAAVSSRTWSLWRLALYTVNHPSRYTTPCFDCKAISGSCVPVRVDTTNSRRRLSHINNIVSTSFEVRSFFSHRSVNT